MSDRILLLSAYDAASHRLWRERLSLMLAEYEFVQLTLPPRHFNWRIRGNSLQWGFGSREVLQQDYQLLIATSMVDLASLRGLVPALSRIPSLVYFHENQFAYPAGSQRSDNIEPQLVPLYSALCADAIVFNSQFNRRSFLEGVRGLFQRLPDQLPAEIMTRLETSTVIPVPLPDIEFVRDNSAADNALLEVIWNHRWDYDKGPATLLQLTAVIQQQQVPIRLHIVGEQFRSQPTEFLQIKQLLERHKQQLNCAAGQFGYVEDRSEYYRLLASCDVVLSTALHDFQGLAVQEACAAGCTPLAPDSLVYPEYLDSKFLYGDNGSTAEIAATILARLQHWQQQKSSGAALPKTDLEEFKQTTVGTRYRQLLTEMIESAK